MKKPILLLVFLALNCASILQFASATTYYVSPVGTSSGPGTMESPYNLSTAIAKSLVAGDSIIARGGLYTFTSLQQYSKSGSAINFIHVVNYLSEIPILDFRNQPYNSNNQGVKISGNFVHFKGFVIQGAGDNGLQVTGSNNKIENCTFRWNCDSGMQLKTGSNNLILNCDSYENFDYQSGGISSPDYGGNADGFADKQYTNTGTNTYKGCRSWRNGDDGWDSYEKVGNTVYDNCWCYGMASASFDMSQNIRFKTDSATWFYQFKSTNFVIKNYGNGNGFKLGGNFTTNNATLNNCVSVGNTVKGFDQNNNAGIMTVYNCTSYNNGSNYGFSNSSYGTLIIKNSASLSSKSSNSFSSKLVTQDYNTWNTGFSCSASDFVSLDYNQLLNDRKADGSLPEITLLHLVQTSGMIDKGINVGMAFFGSAPDLGAFEYGLQTDIIQVSTDNSTMKIYYSSTNQSISINGSVSAIEIYDLKGKRIISKQLSNDKSTLTVGDLNKGIYLVRFLNQTGNWSCKKIFVD